MCDQFNGLCLLPALTKYLKVFFLSNLPTELTKHLVYQDRIMLKEFSDAPGLVMFFIYANFLEKRAMCGIVDSN